MSLLSRLLRREDEAPTETTCPRCGESAPPGAIDCTVCGWDLRDAYHQPNAGDDRLPAA